MKKLPIEHIRDILSLNTTAYQKRNIFIQLTKALNNRVEEENIPGIAPDINTRYDKADSSYNSLQVNYNYRIIYNTELGKRPIY